MARVNFAGQVLRGKSNGVIYSTWKGIHYMKGYAIPKNPRTEKQMANRNKFGLASQYAASLYKTLYDGFYPEESKSELYRAILTQCKKIFEEDPESIDDYNLFNDNFVMPFTTASPFSDGFFGIYHKSENPRNVNTIWVSTTTDLSGQSFDMNVYYFENIIDVPICYKRPIIFEYDESEENYSAEIDVQMAYTSFFQDVLNGQVQISKDGVFYSAFRNYNLYN